MIRSVSPADRASARSSLFSGHRRWITAAILVVGSLFTVSSVAAQQTGSIEGKVVPPHDHAFTLTTVAVPDLNLEVRVAGDGSFSFDPVRAGSWLLVVRSPTLGSAVERVTVEAGEASRVELTLEPGSHFEELFVAAGDARDSLELASPTAVLSGQELRMRQEATLGETLANEPGINSTFFASGASRPIIRGLGGDRVRVLETGVSSGDASDVSVDHAVTADPALMDSIEVIRGPATLLYGSSAIGGVINTVDGRIPTTRAAAPISGTVDLGGNSVADERMAAAQLRGGSGDWAWYVGGVSREADDYEIPGFAAVEEDEHGEEHDEHEEDEHGEEHDEHEEEEENAFGFVPNSDFETTNFRGGVTRFFGDKGFLGVSVSGFDTDYGLPPGAHGHGEEHGEEHDEHDDDHEDEGEHDEDHEDEHGEEGEHDEHGEGPVRLEMEQRRFDLRGEVRQDFGIFRAARVRIGVTDYEHIEFEGDEIGTQYFNDSVEGRFEFVQQQRGRSSGVIGLQFEDRELEAIGAEAFIPPSDQQRSGIFTLQEFAASDAFTWQLGARWESQSTDSAGFDSVDHDGISASLGFVWGFSDGWSLASSLSRSVKLPNMGELFSFGPHIGTQVFEIGDPTLDEEIGLGFDVSLRREVGRVQGSLTVFRQDFDGFIYERFTGEEEDELPVIVWSQEDAEFTGAELEGRVELFESDGRHLHWALSGDLVEAELDRGGNVPRIPPMRFGTGLHYHSESWNGMVEVRWVDDQNDVGAEETPTEGYTLLNANLGYRWIVGDQIIDFLLRGRNLTDEEARVHTSFNKNFQPLPGRNVSLSARLWF